MHSPYFEHKVHMSMSMGRVQPTRKHVSCILFSLVNGLDGKWNGSQKRKIFVRKKFTFAYLRFLLFSFLNITDNRRNLYSRRSPTITLRFTIAIINNNNNDKTARSFAYGVPRSTGHDKVIMKK